jgi:hypothetical protein
VGLQSPQCRLANRGRRNPSFKPKGVRKSRLCQMVFFETRRNYGNNDFCSTGCSFGDLAAH